jgi:NTE family protein
MSNGFTVPNPSQIPTCQPGVETQQATALAPAEFIATDDPANPPRAGIALCLSGGGYRAMLFHVGVLMRLNEMGQLPTIDKISSVSGGSITAGVLGVKWGRLDFHNSVAINFRAEVVDPIQKLAAKTIDIPAVLGGLGAGGTANQIVREYRNYLFGDATLQALPTSKPMFVINATNMQSKALWRFTKA